jgi:nitroreductase
MAHAPMPDAERLAEPLRSRYSPVVFDPAHELSPDEIATLLEAARWAPSWGNTQPWRLGVAPRGSAANTLLVENLSRGNDWVARASVVFLGGTQIAKDEEGKGPDEPTYSYHDLGQAAAHITLQARAMGLQAHQFAGYDHDAVAAGLGVPPYVRLISGIAVGLPADPAIGTEREQEKEQRERVRKPLSATTYGDRWGTPWR